MNEIEQKARETYTNHIPKINDFVKIFEDLKGKLSAITLQEDEEILLCTEIFSGAASFGFLLATDKKLIYIKPAILSKGVQYISYSKIQTVEFKKSFMKSNIYIHMVDGEKLELFHSKCDAVAGLLNDILEDYHTGSLPKKVSIKETKSTDVISRIQELFDMKEKGILSHEEFEILKKNLIDTQ